MPYNQTNNFWVQLSACAGFKVSQNLGQPVQMSGLLATPALQKQPTDVKAELCPFYQVR